MKFTFVISLVTALLSTSFAATAHEVNIVGDAGPHILRDLFQKWLLKHEKVYDSIEETQTRFHIWRENNCEANFLEMNLIIF
mmetsp:Transcript_60071/g.70184  ORF Transcript_60071/g.70184 Transcript_60071/m.70184 type:complete len:82 (-) Transcript_60071:647-892(-)